MDVGEWDQIIAEAWFRANATPEQKARVAEKVMSVVRLMPSAIERDEWMKRISEALGVSLEALRRDGKVAAGPQRAPLDADPFAAWAWAQGPRAAGTGPVTVDDLAFDLGVDREVVAADLERLAARVRANQDDGCEAWEGIR